MLLTTWSNIWSTVVVVTDAPARASILHARGPSTCALAASDFIRDGASRTHQRLSHEAISLTRILRRTGNSIMVLLGMHRETSDDF